MFGTALLLVVEEIATLGTGPGACSSSEAQAKRVSVGTTALTLNQSSPDTGT